MESKRASASSAPIGPCRADTEREFLRVAQEAIHNVKKHAGAKHLWRAVGIWAGRDRARGARRWARVSVVDEAAESPPGHYGLTGMRERAEAIGRNSRSNERARRGHDGAIAGAGAERHKGTIGGVMAEDPIRVLVVEDHHVVPPGTGGAAECSGWH